MIRATNTSAITTIMNIHTRAAQTQRQQKLGNANCTRSAAVAIEQADRVLVDDEMLTSRRAANAHVRRACCRPPPLPAFEFMACPCRLANSSPPPTSFGRLSFFLAPLPPSQSHTTYTFATATTTRDQPAAASMCEQVCCLRATRVWPLNLLFRIIQRRLLDLTIVLF